MTIRTIKPSLHWSNPAVERVLYFYGFKRMNIATNAQCMLLAIATTSITLIPVTAIGLRAGIQSKGAAEIIAPVIIATTISTITGIFFTIVLGKFKRWNYDNIIKKEMAAGTLEINEDYIGDDPIVLPEEK